MSYTIAGKQCRESTGTADKEEAKKILATKIVKGKVPDKRSIGKVLDDLATDFGPENAGQCSGWTPRRKFPVGLRAGVLSPSELDKGIYSWPWERANVDGTNAGESRPMNPATKPAPGRFYAEKGRTMFANIGFFHFGENHTDPLEELRKELDKTKRCKGPLAGSLIVLPEGFNIRKRYNDTKTRCRFYRDDPSRLRDVAKEFGVAFVAGLILERECGGTTKRYSSAYFIDGSSQVLMCHKTCKDSFEGKDIGDDDTEHNYTACEVADCDVRNPYDGVKGIVIGALICADANPPKTLRDETYWNRVLTIVKASDVICVPAHMDKNILGDGKVGSSAALTSTSVWKNKFLILANSRPNGINSFVTDGAGIIREPAICDPENRVITLPLISPTVGR